MSKVNFLKTNSILLVCLVIWKVKGNKLRLIKFHDTPLFLLDV